MDTQTINEEYELESELYHYHTLRQWLTYEAYGLLIWVAVFFAPVGYVVAGAALFAFAFLPIMVRELLEVDRPRWIVGWAVAVLLPTLVAYFLGPDERQLFWTAVVFLSVSYTFFWALRVSVISWTRQLVHGLEALRRPGLEMD